MWREIAKRYSIRAREFSDAVADLGREARLGPKPPQDLLKEIRRRRELCNEVADEFERSVKLNIPSPESRGHSAS
jgi:hypothetical protein